MCSKNFLLEYRQKGLLIMKLRLTKIRSRPHRPFYQLSPAELEAAKSFVQDSLPKWKLRPSKSPYGASLFFCKEKDNPLRAVVDYRVFKHITKRNENNAPLPRSYEI